MVLGVVARLKNGELLMAGVVGGDCRDKMVDKLPKSYTRCYIKKEPLIFNYNSRISWSI